MKQTAVEWFYGKLLELEYQKSTKQIILEQFVNERFKLLNQAKEIEKEQIMEAHYAPKYGCFSQDYYNETFNTNEK